MNYFLNYSHGSKEGIEVNTYRNNGIICDSVDEFLNMVDDESEAALTIEGGENETFYFFQITYPSC